MHLHATNQVTITYLSSSNDTLHHSLVYFAFFFGVRSDGERENRIVCVSLLPFCTNCSLLLTNTLHT